MKEQTGNLIEQSGKFDVIVHGCNCFCTMGAGFAKQVKEKWPYAYKVDCFTRKGSISKLGSISVSYGLPDIVNAYTQYEYGNDKKHMDYEALVSCLEEVKKSYSGKKIAMPRIGCGMAGGSWEIVKEILERELGGEDLTIFSL